MSSNLDEYLDEVDQWKLKVHERLARLTAKQRRELWASIAGRARAMGLRVIEPDKSPKPSAKRPRRTA